MKINLLQKVKKVQVSIASKQLIENKWSRGEVLKPETVNYKSSKPEIGGLFDERIFGPTKDFVCTKCGKKHKVIDIGKPCISCGESIIYSKMVRRRFMGHIQLAMDVSHIWFSKVDYSTIRTILGLKQEELDSVLYYKSHIIYNVGNFKKIKIGKIIDVQHAPSIYKKILTDIKLSTKDSSIRKSIDEKVKSLNDDTQSDIGQTYGIDFYEYNDFISEISNIKIGTGAEAIKYLLEKIDLEKLEKQLLNEIVNKKDNQNSINRRLKIVESFMKSKQAPSQMILDVIPVIPADLRPLVQLDGGRFSTADINELYRRIIIRNNRLKQWLLLGAPMLIVQNEKRMLQESVDALFDNTRKKQPVLSKNDEPLKSLAESLKGKQGRFRQNLLGKRVDYSGRSVIVVGPELNLHQVGLPKQMVIKLFEPFIVKSLMDDKIVKTTKQAKKMIEVLDDRIWKYASKVIKNHPVLLNRAPTLHRLSIQAFEPKIESGKAIRLHPLVTPSFNADFDGDQMAVYVPLSKKAKDEAWNLMLSSKNVLGPKDGKLILTPSQDIVLGVYFLTKITSSFKTNKFIPRYFSSINDIENSLILKNIEVGDIILISLSIFPDKFVEEIKNGYRYLITSVGRLLINKSLPKSMVYINHVDINVFKLVDPKYLIKDITKLEEAKEHFIANSRPYKKSHIATIIEQAYEIDQNEIELVLDSIKELGFIYSTFSGTSMSIFDIVDLSEREKIIKKGEKQVNTLDKLYEDGYLTDDQRYLQVLKCWGDVRDEVKDELQKVISQKEDNSLFMMMDSGARGNISNFVQLAGLRGLMSKATHEYAALKRQNILVRSIEEIPIKSSFKIGLTPFEYFLSTHGARKGLSDTATKTAESGYLTRRLVDAVQDVLITIDDCKTNLGVEVKAIKDTRTNSIIEDIDDRVVGRFLSDDLKIGSEVVKKNTLVTADIAQSIKNNGIEKVNIRSVLTCNAKQGICKKCFGIDLTTNKEVNIGEAIGIISAQSIGEPGTQLTMRTFHTGGIAGVLDITQGFARLMELVDANKNPKSQATISHISGVVEDIKVGTSLTNKITNYEVIIKNDIETESYKVDSTSILRIKKGQKIQVGQKITEGTIVLQELLKYAGPRATENYLIKEMQRLYRIQGINIADKYTEIIIRQMLSRFQVIDAGGTNLFVSQIISIEKLKEANYQAFLANKKPAFAIQIILGVKTLPLYSESFLAAASYQRTVEALVGAAISKKTDVLYGIKENLIIGKLIPVGTGQAKPQGKYVLSSTKYSVDEEDYYNYISRKDFKSRLTKMDYQAQDEFRVVNDEKLTDKIKNDNTLEEE